MRRVFLCIVNMNSYIQGSIYALFVNQTSWHITGQLDDGSQEETLLPCQSECLLSCNHGNLRPTFSHSPSMTWLRNLVAEGCSSLQPDSCISRSTVWLQRHREGGRGADSKTHDGQVKRRESMSLKNTNQSGQIKSCQLSQLSQCRKLIAWNAIKHQLNFSYSSISDHLWWDKWVCFLWLANRWVEDLEQ